MHATWILVLTYNYSQVLKCSQIQSQSSYYLFFKIFLGACPRSQACFACLLYIVHYRYPVCLRVATFFYTFKKCPEILPDQCKIASSAPVMANTVVIDVYCYSHCPDDGSKVHGCYFVMALVVSGII